MELELDGIAESSDEAQQQLNRHIQECIEEILMQYYKNTLQFHNSAESHAIGERPATQHVGGEAALGPQPQCRFQNYFFAVAARITRLRSFLGGRIFFWYFFNRTTKMHNKFPENKCTVGKIPLGLQPQRMF